MSTLKMQTGTREKVMIDTPFTFEAWEKSLSKFNSYRSSKNYVFNISEFSFYENVNISTEVDHYTMARGSRTGSVVMSLTFIILVSDFFIRGGNFSAITFYDVLALIGLTMVGAFIGRAIGLLHAHWNLVRIARNIRKRLTAMHNVKQMKIARS